MKTKHTVKQQGGLPWGEEGARSCLWRGTKACVTAAPRTKTALSTSSQRRPPPSCWTCHGDHCTCNSCIWAASRGEEGHGVAQHAPARAVQRLQSSNNTIPCLKLQRKQEHRWGWVGWNVGPGWWVMSTDWMGVCCSISFVVIPFEAPRPCNGCPRLQRGWGVAQVARPQWGASGNCAVDATGRGRGQTPHHVIACPLGVLRRLPFIAVCSF